MINESGQRVWPHAIKWRGDYWRHSGKIQHLFGAGLAMIVRFPTTPQELYGGAYIEWIGFTRKDRRKMTVDEWGDATEHEWITQELATGEKVNRKWIKEIQNGEPDDGYVDLAITHPHLYAKRGYLVEYAPPRRIWRK